MKSLISAILMTGLLACTNLQAAAQENPPMPPTPQSSLDQGQPAPNDSQDSQAPAQSGQTPTPAANPYSQALPNLTLHVDTPNVVVPAAPTTAVKSFRRDTRVLEMPVDSPDPSNTAYLLIGVGVGVLLVLLALAVGIGAYQPPTRPAA